MEDRFSLSYTLEGGRLLDAASKNGIVPALCLLGQATKQHSGAGQCLTTMGCPNTFLLPSYCSQNTALWLSLVGKKALSYVTQSKCQYLVCILLLVFLLQKVFVPHKKHLVTYKIAVVDLYSLQQQEAGCVGYG
jgi:hypothetical protein